MLRNHGLPENLERKLEKEGFSRVGKAVFKEGVMTIKFSSYWKNLLTLDIHDYEHRFISDYCLPNQPKLAENEIYIYARIRHLNG